MEDDKMNTKTKIGEYIKEKRIEKSLTVEEIAERTGTAAAQVEKWESGERYPGVFQLEPLCRVLGCTVTQLQSGTDDADADILILELLKKLERYRGILLAVVGILLTQMPLHANYEAETSLGQFFTGLVDGIGVGCAIVGVFVFVYGAAMFIGNRNKA